MKTKQFKHGKGQYIPVKRLEAEMCDKENGSMYTNMIKTGTAERCRIDKVVLSDELNDGENDKPYRIMKGVGVCIHVDAFCEFILCRIRKSGGDRADEINNLKRYYAQLENEGHVYRFEFPEVATAERIEEVFAKAINLVLGKHIGIELNHKIYSRRGCGRLMYQFDVYLSSIWTPIELDELHHKDAGSKKRDQRRDELLKSMGYNNPIRVPSYKISNVHAQVGYVFDELIKRGVIAIADGDTSDDEMG